MRKLLKNKLLKNILLASTIALSSILPRCGVETRFFDNYEDPVSFYAAEARTNRSIANITATLGSVISVVADNQREAALGAGLSTYGGLQSNQEASREGRSIIDFSQTSVQAAADATSIPGYDLGALTRILRDGHWLKQIDIDHDPLFGNTFMSAGGVYFYKIDGIQHLFTCREVFDSNSDGFISSLEECVGVGKTFKKGDPMVIVLGIRGSPKTVKKNAVTQTANVSVKIYHKNSLLAENRKGFNFYRYNKDETFLTKVNTSELEPGIYWAIANYSDEIIQTQGKGRMVTDRGQAFQILP